MIHCSKRVRLPAGCQVAAGGGGGGIWIPVLLLGMWYSSFGKIFLFPPGAKLIFKGTASSCAAVVIGCTLLFKVELKHSRALPLPSTPHYRDCTILRDVFRELLSQCSLPKEKRSSFLSSQERPVTSILPQVANDKPSDPAVSQSP